MAHVSTQAGCNPFLTGAAIRGPKLAAAALLAIAAVLFASAVPAIANDHDDGPSKAPSRFSSAIESVVSAFDALPPTPSEGYANALGAQSSQVAALFSSGVLQTTDDGLQVYVHVDGIDDDLRDSLTALGAIIEIESAELGIVQAIVPFGALTGVSEVEGVRVVTQPAYGFANVGANLTDGDAILSFDALRAAQGVDGTGVTVGVISDGIAGLQTAVGSGDLPATSETRPGGVLTATSGGVIATSFRADGDLKAGLGVAVGAEGTAILEIVHDIAPGAQLRFANFSTSIEFMAAVNFLASVSDVVIDDIGFFGAPTDQSIDVSVNTASALTDAANPIRAYATSAGNHALRHYEALFLAGADGTGITGIAGALHTFAGSSVTTDAQGLGAVTRNEVVVPPGGAIVIRLTWDDDFGPPRPTTTCSCAIR